jgi:hypothetical protein
MTMGLRAEKITRVVKLGILENDSPPLYYTYLIGGNQAADVTYTMPTALPSSASFVKCGSDGILTFDTTVYYKSADTVTFADITDSGLTASQAVLTDANKKLVSADYLDQAVKTTSAPQFAGLKVKEGSNAHMGVATLSSGAATVSTTAVHTTSRIFLAIQSLGTVSVAKGLAVTARTDATSFVITSADATDTSVVAWQIFDPM